LIGLLVSGDEVSEGTDVLSLELGAARVTEGGRAAVGLLWAGEGLLSENLLLPNELQNIVTPGHGLVSELSNGLAVLDVTQVVRVTVPHAQSANVA
jgi:hypothetical protein